MKFTIDDRINEIHNLIYKNHTFDLDLFVEMGYNIRKNRKGVRE